MVSSNWAGCACLGLADRRPSSRTGHHAELERKVEPGWQLTGELDYIPGAKIWLLTINSPPSLLSMPFIALVAKLKFAPQFVFLLAVTVFWYWIGSMLDKRAKPARVPDSVRAR